MGKKSKTKESSQSATNFNTVTTPTNPEWVTQGVQGVQGRINSLLSTDASTLVPGASGLQQQAFAGAQGLGQPNAGITGAQDAVRGILDGDPREAMMASAGRVIDADLQAYQNPFTEGVVNTTLSGFDRSADRVRAQQAMDMARGARFGGSRSAITASMTEGELAQQRAAQEAGLRAAGFDRATGLATSDLDRSSNVSMFNAGQANQFSMQDQAQRLQAAGLLGDLGQAQAATTRADLGLLTDMGGQEREIERQVRGSDVELTKLIAALNASQPYELFRGQTATGTENRTGSGTSTTTESDPMGTLGKAVQIGATIFSDKRMKADVRTVGKDAAGRRLVSYRYKGDDQRRVGHIAQEVKKTDPHAVQKVGNRYAINYGLLGDVA